MRFLLFLLPFALSAQELTVQYSGAAAVNSKLLTYDAASPTEFDLGTIGEGGTAQFSNKTNIYVLVASGTNISFNLPAQPYSAGVIMGVMKNTSGTNQIVSLKIDGVLTRLVRAERLVTISSFTNLAGAYTRFVFYASKGQWSDFAVTGDAP